MAAQCHNHLVYHLLVLTGTSHDSAAFVAVAEYSGGSCGADRSMFGGRHGNYEIHGEEGLGFPVLGSHRDLQARLRDVHIQAAAFPGPSPRSVKKQIWECVNSWET